MRAAAQRLAWFVGLWAASVATLGVAAYGLRLLFSAMGMKS